MNVDRILSLIRHNTLHMRRAAGSGLVITSGLLIMRISAFVVSVLVARIAGAVTLGEYTLFITVFILASEIPHAFDTAYLRAVGSPGGIDHKKTYEAANVAIKLLLLIFLTVIFISMSDVISAGLGNRSSGQIVFWAVICGGLNSVYMLIPAMAQQRRDYWTVARLKPIYNLAVLGLISILLIYGMALDIGAIYKVYILVGLVLGLWSIMVTYRGQVFEKTSMKHVRSYLAASSVLLVSTALTMVGNRLDVFFLGHYLNFEQLGVYGVALRISIIISVMTAVMSIVMIPRATEAAADSEKFKRYMALGGFYAGIQLVFGVILLLLVGPLIHVMFGAEYSHAVLPASILIGQVLATSIGIPFQSLLQCGGRPSRMVYIALIRIILTVPLLQWLIPRYAVVGAALAVTTTTLLLTVIMMFLAIKHRPVLQG